MSRKYAQLVGECHRILDCLASKGFASVKKLEIENFEPYRILDKKFLHACSDAIAVIKVIQERLAACAPELREELAEKLSPVVPEEIGHLMEKEAVAEPEEVGSEYANQERYARDAVDRFNQMRPLHAGPMPFEWAWLIFFKPPRRVMQSTAPILAGPLEVGIPLRDVDMALDILREDGLRLYCKLDLRAWDRYFRGHFMPETGYETWLKSTEDLTRIGETLEDPCSDDERTVRKVLYEHNKRRYIDIRPYSEISAPPPHKIAK